MQGVRALAFDTGGTILDWHGGLVAALAEFGGRYAIEHDWRAFANEYRRRSLRRMLSSVDPDFTIDNVHRDVLDDLLTEHGITAFAGADRQTIAERWHQLAAWPDFVPALDRLRGRYVCVSFTILTLSLVPGMPLYPARCCASISRAPKPISAPPNCWQWLHTRSSWLPATISISTRRAAPVSALHSFAAPTSGGLPGRPIRCRTRHATSSLMVLPSLAIGSGCDTFSLILRGNAGNGRAENDHHDV